MSMIKHVATPPSDPDNVVPLTTQEEADRQAEMDAWNAVNLKTLKDKLKAHLADYRWRKEVGGIVFGGLPIRTDERSRSLLSGVQRKIVKEADGTITRKVKTEAGFQVINNATLEALYDAVVTHVQDCFDIEEGMIALIDNDTLTTEAAIEVEFDAQYAAL